MEYGLAKKVAAWSHANREPNKQDDWIQFCMKRLRTLKSFKIFKSEIKKLKTYSGWCAFKGLSNDTTLMQIQSGRTVPLRDHCFIEGLPVFKDQPKIRSWPIQRTRFIDNWSKTYRSFVAFYYCLPKNNICGILVIWVLSQKVLKIYEQLSYSALTTRSDLCLGWGPDTKMLTVSL